MKWLRSMRSRLMLWSSFSITLTLSVPSSPTKKTKTSKKSSNNLTVVIETKIIWALTNRLKLHSISKLRDQLTQATSTGKTCRLSCLRDMCADSSSSWLYSPFSTFRSWFRCSFQTGGLRVRTTRRLTVPSIKLLIIRICLRIGLLQHGANTIFRVNGNRTCKKAMIRTLRKSTKI